MATGSLSYEDWHFQFTFFLLLIISKCWAIGYHLWLWAIPFIVSVRLCALWEFLRSGWVPCYRQAQRRYLHSTWTILLLYTRIKSHSSPTRLNAGSLYDQSTDRTCLEPRCPYYIFLSTNVRSIYAKIRHFFWSWHLLHVFFQTSIAEHRELCSETSSSLYRRSFADGTPSTHLGQ